MLMDELMNNIFNYDTFIISSVDWNKILRNKSTVSKVFIDERGREDGDVEGGYGNII